MKKLLFIALFLGGCAYTQTTITADNWSTVNCTSTVDKPVSVAPALQGNVPMQGSTVTEPSLNQVPK